jgi:hypothetical protein
MAPVEIMFKIILVAVPALSRVDPAMTSAPTRAAIGLGFKQAGSVADDRGGASAPRAGFSDGTENVWGPAGRSDANHQVVGGDGELSNVGCAATGIILGSLDRARQCGGAAGDEPDDHRGGRAERGRTFRGVEDTQSARGASSDVNEPGASSNTVGGPFDHPRD